MKSFFFSIIIFLLISSMSFANDSIKNWYVGVGYGGSEVNTGISGLTGTAALDENDKGWKLFGGYQFTQYLGIEATYANLGEATLTGNNGDGFSLGGSQYTFIVNGANITAEATTIALEGVVYLPLGYMFQKGWLNYVTLFGKVGANFWEVEYAASASGVNRQTTDEDDIDIVFGGGINFNIYKNFVIRAEIERYRMVEDIDYYSASAIFRF